MLEQFIEQLLKEKNMPADMDPEIKTQLVKDLTVRLEDLINRRLIDSMTEEQLGQFNQLLDKEPADPAAVQNFVSENIKNKEEITTGALLEFRQLYLGPTS